MEGRRTDFVDMVSFTPGIVAIIYYLSEGPAGWKAASTLAPLVVGIALLIGFAVYQNKIYYPIILFISGSPGDWSHSASTTSSALTTSFTASELTPLSPTWFNRSKPTEPKSPSSVKSIADANDEDQGVVGTMYNVGLRLGAPVVVALSSIITNSHNSPTAVGAELLPGYHAVFYTEAVLGGIGLLIAILYAATQRPCRGGWKARVRAPRGYRSRGCQSCC
ncbi:hypothetical protein F5H01DRAFT_324180 [Linnemannia elongata]|nr:hypothetical protein F5H01DRAFT_324180 [Linnemannia elongata]